jgi:hypothetical protein
MQNEQLNQQTEKILAEFFTITDVPADKIDIVRRWMQPVIETALVHYNISQTALAPHPQPWEGMEPELIRASIEAQKEKRIVV